VPPALDVKHVGLLISAGAAVALRCFSDFGFATIQQNARVAGLDLTHVTIGSFSALVSNAIVDELQRDWFNLSPQAPLQVCVVIAGLVGLYALLRRAWQPETAVLAVLLVTPLLPFAATAAACAVVLLRAARTA
jgi:hypothetical protein